MARSPFTTEIEGVKAGIAAQFKKEAKKGPEDDGEGADAAGGNESSGQTPQLVFFNPIFADKIADLLVGMKKDNPKAFSKFIGEKAKRSKEEEKAADEAISAFRKQAFNARES